MQKCTTSMYAKNSLQPDPIKDIFFRSFQNLEKTYFTDHFKKYFSVWYFPPLLETFCQNKVFLSEFLW